MRRQRLAACAFVPVISVRRWLQILVVEADYKDRQGSIAGGLSFNLHMEYVNGNQHLSLGPEAVAPAASMSHPIGSQERI